MGRPINFVPDESVLAYLELVKRAYGQKSMSATIGFIVMEHKRVVGVESKSFLFDSDGVLKRK